MSEEPQGGAGGMKKLPANWTTAGIEEALLPFGNGQTLRQGWSPQCERFAAETEDDWGVLKTTAIQDGEFQPEHNKRLPSALEPDPLLEVQEGDLLLTCAGPRVRCGVICLVRETRRRLMVSGKMYRFRTDPRIALATYLEAFLRSHDTKKRIDEMKTGISDSGLNLTLSRFKTLQVPLPPIPEQRRIVAKIEELFSELDEGIENLKQARAQLAVYRQALLKHAFEGKLTAGWRAAHANQLESAAKGSTEDLPMLPKGWLWQRLSDISVVSGGLTKNPKRESLPRKMKYLRVANVYADRLDLDEVSEIGVTDDEARRLALEKGDLLVVEGNGSIDQIGRVAEWKGSIQDCGHQNHLIRARLHASVLSRFALRFLQSPRGRDAIVKAASSTSGLHTLSISKVGYLNIPVAPFSEQETLLGLIEPAFDYIDSLESDIDANLQKAEALRQSILKKAFAGELVPQDPADEPAAALLARIRAERAAASSAKPVRTRGRPSASAPSA
jgi:type I restriction enzyme, S subunit